MKSNENVPFRAWNNFKNVAVFSIALLLAPKEAFSCGYLCIYFLISEYFRNVLNNNIVSLQSLQKKCTKLAKIKVKHRKNILGNEKDDFRQHSVKQ